MPRVMFTSNLKRHVDCPDQVAHGGTVGEVLEAVFAEHEQLRGYIVDEQGRLRTHMAIFVDGRPLKDRERLGDAVESTSEIYVMQALSGG